MDHKLKSIQNLLAIFLLALLGGCAHPSKTPEETIARTADDAGTSGCEDCYLIKTLLSPTAASGTYAPKDEKDTPTGKWISASIVLGATNRAGGPSNGIALEKFVYEYSSTLTEEHMFEGPFKASGNKPFRPFVRILHNSSFTDQDVYLVTSKAEYIRPMLYIDDHLKASVWN